MLFFADGEEGSNKYGDDTIKNRKPKPEKKIGAVEEVEPNVYDQIEKLKKAKNEIESPK